MELDQGDGSSVRILFFPDRPLHRGQVYQFLVRPVPDLAANESDPFVQNFTTAGPRPLQG